MTLTLRLAYMLMMSLKSFMVVLFSMLSSIPAEPNFMCLEIVIRNAIPLTFITSAERVTCLYCCMMDIGIVYEDGHMDGDCLRTVFHMRLPR